MSRDALRDAFRAGWNGGRTGPTRLADDAFDEWWTKSVETGDRAPVCPDNSHDYRVDDSDGVLKCTTCGKVLF